jgi:hypothetical protein
MIIKRKKNSFNNRLKRKKKNKKSVSIIREIKILLILSLTWIFYKLTKINYKDENENNVNNESNIIKIGKDNFHYFSCFVGEGKLENRYVRELVDYYLSIGVEQFYFGDDNEVGTENLEDVLQDYINNNKVHVFKVRQFNLTQTAFYDKVFVKIKHKCDWIFFYDLDEYLEFKDKNMTIKDYLSKKEFEKCDVIKIHWIVFGDNDLVYYDNRPLRERFNKPNYNSNLNRFHKSIVRGKDYNGTIWIDRGSPHQPYEPLVNMCNAVGDLANDPPGILGVANYKYGYIRHFRLKTAEEYALKIKRGLHQNQKPDYYEKIDEFFENNKFTEEKLAVFEKILNMTFLKYHHKSI